MISGFNSRMEPEYRNEVPKPDFEVTFDGSLYLMHPCSPEAVQWLDEHIGEEAQFFGQALVVEHHYIRDIVEGAQADGLVVA